MVTFLYDGDDDNEDIFLGRVDTEAEADTIRFCFYMLMIF